MTGIQQSTANFLKSALAVRQFRIPNSAFRINYALRIINSEFNYAFRIDSITDPTAEYTVYAIFS